MKTETIQSQAEVWEWKESVYRQIKDLPSSDYLKFIKQQTKATVEEILKRRFQKQQSSSHSG